MRKEYLVFLPVASEKTADLLKNEAVWSVLKCVRKSGTEGITAEKISEKLGESPSTVYNALRQLERVGYVRGVKMRKWLKKVGRPPSGIKTKKEFKRPGKSPKVYTEPCDKVVGLVHRTEGEKENPWGDVIFSKKFDEEIGRLVKNDKSKDKLFKSLVEFIEPFYLKLSKSNRNDIKNILPDVADKCRECKESHELEEFIKAIAYYVCALFLNSENAKKMKKHIHESENSQPK